MADFMKRIILSILMVLGLTVGCMAQNATAEGWTKVYENDDFVMNVYKDVTKLTDGNYGAWVDYIYNEPNNMRGQQYKRAQSFLVFTPDLKNVAPRDHYYYNERGECFEKVELNELKWIETDWHIFKNVAEFIRPILQNQIPN